MRGCRTWAIAATRGPDAFIRLDVIVAFVRILVVAHTVEDKKLGLGSEAGGVTDTCLLQIALSLLRDIAGVARTFFTCHRVDDTADQRQRGLLIERGR